MILLRLSLETIKINRFSNYIPILSTIFLTWLFASMIIYVDIRPGQPPITPFQEPEPSTPPGQALLNPAPYLNTILFISVLTISSIVILYLVRKKTNIFRKLITTLLLMISFGVFAYYILIASIIFQIPFTTYQLLLSAILAILVTYFIIRGRELGTTLSSAIIASGAGGVLGASIPYWTFIILVVAISVYDIVAVFRGHLSTITKIDAPMLKGLLIEIGDLAIGFGDLFFYSLTITSIIINNGTVPAIASTLSILAGYTITLYLLSKRKRLPGLPIPLLLALTVALITHYTL
ncbi:MAG: presenilin family intramembrane aspartyl protease [Nitrososphaerota archaeon]